MSALRTALRFWRDARGVSAIEFAMLAMVFFTLIFGIVIYGAYFASLMVVHHIASEAARATVSGLTDDERSTLAHARADEVEASFSTFLDAATLQVDTTAAGQGLYEVTVSQEFDSFGLTSISPFLPLPPAHQTATVQVSHGGY